jgi:uncharacterized protein YyaL (SSP411 family)
MSHETFAQDDIARFLNEFFTCIKVDREEFPDVDDWLMSVVQTTSGRGGWPMTVFMTPDKEPFFAGTYFPLEDRGSFPGFRTLTRRIVELWSHDREPLISSAKALTDSVVLASNPLPVFGGWSKAETLSYAIGEILDEFRLERDRESSAPKFPPHAALMLLQRLADPEVDELIDTMLRRIVCGGIHDHVGGGFHRYSTDSEWKLPHFEKMLYDNALLLSSLAEWKNPYAGIVIRKTISFLLTEMRLKDGTFASALNADSLDPTTGIDEEGAYYVWSLVELKQVLGDRAETLIRAISASQEGNYCEESTGHVSGLNVLHFGEAVPFGFEPEFELLKQARSRRTAPVRDSKAIASWNGMTVIALLKTGEVAAATRCLTSWLRASQRFGGLPHVLYESVPSGKGFVDDLAWMFLAVQCFEKSTGDTRFSDWQTDLLRRLHVFADSRNGGFMMGESSISGFVSKQVLDTPIPSPTSVAIKVLLECGALDQASFHLDRLHYWMLRAPTSCASLVEALLLSPIENEPEISIIVQGEIAMIQLRADLKFNLDESSPIKASSESDSIRFDCVPRLNDSRTASIRLPAGIRFVDIEYDVCSDSVCFPTRAARVLLDPANVSE